jgi:mRNA interferase RelE/StbE
MMYRAATEVVSRNEVRPRIRPQAVRNFRRLLPKVAKRIIAKIEALRDNLAGDVKRLVHFTPEYRLRVGDYRVLFAIHANRIMVYRVLHRREAYDR